MSTTREQYLQKRLQILEDQVVVLCAIIERLESLANAFAFDLAREIESDESEAEGE